jgi:hypothetical protein
LAASQILSSEFDLWHSESKFSASAQLRIVFPVNMAMMIGLCCHRALRRDGMCWIEDEEGMVLLLYLSLLIFWLVVGISY